MFKLKIVDNNELFESIKEVLYGDCKDSNVVYNFKKVVMTYFRGLR